MLAEDTPVSGPRPEVARYGASTDMNIPPSMPVSNMSISPQRNNTPDSHHQEVVDDLCICDKCPFQDRASRWCEDKVGEVILQCKCYVVS